MLITSFLACLLFQRTFSSDSSFERLKQIACVRNSNFSFCNGSITNNKVQVRDKPVDTVNQKRMVSWSEFTVPCKPDCDEAEFAHCTTQCKCEYLRPIVQKFCNPPVPSFLKICRLWTKGCTVSKTQTKDDELTLPPREVEPILSDFSISHKRPSKVAKSTLSTRDLAKGLKLFSKFVNSPIEAAKDLINQQKNSPSSERPKAQASSSFPVIPSDASYGAGDADAFRKFDGLTDSRGIVHQPRSSSPFTKPGLWSANPDDPHNRDHANKYYYRPSSVGVDWLNGQVTWGAHWAVPAALVGGTDGFSALHFPTIGNFLNIPDDYD